MIDDAVQNLEIQKSTHRRNSGQRCDHESIINFIQMEFIQGKLIESLNVAGPTTCHAWIPIVHPPSHADACRDYKNAGCEERCVADFGFVRAADPGSSPDQA